MNQTHLTQDVIDGTTTVGANGKSSLYAKAANHPILAGGAVLVGAGLAYAAARILTREENSTVARDVHIETSIAIDKSPEELYRFWRDFSNLPLFMKNLESVTELDERRSHWVAKGPAGARVEWDAEIYNEKENELISWRSLEDADLTNAGSVRFQAGPQGHGTFVRITMNYNPPAGKVGASVAQLLGAEPTQLIKEDLRRLKQVMESGEIASIEGQTSGRAEGATSASEAPAETMGNSEESGDEKMGNAQFAHVAR
jgi:uncharacterized membrane protein